MEDEDTFDTADMYGDENIAAEVDDELDIGIIPDDEDDEPEQHDDDDAPAADGGQGEEVVTEPTKNYFDVNQFADHLARVKVDGEEVEVPVTELANGYMRQADYTRKTQELAFWRSVDQAMRTNPVETLQYLQKQFGVEQAPAPQVPQEDDDWAIEDPIDARLKAFEERLAPVLETVQQQRAKEYLDSVLTQLQGKYDDFDPQEVVTHAVTKLGITDPSGLEYAYKDLWFERNRAAAAAGQLAAQTKAQEDAARAAAAAKASQLVTSGGGAPSRGVPKSPPPQARSIREAWALAKQQHQVD